MAKRTKSGGTPTTDVLHATGVTFSLRAHAHDPRAASYGLEAAEALGARVTGSVIAR